MVKADFADLKEKQIKDLLAVKTWADQKELLDSDTKLQAVTPKPDTLILSRSGLT